MKFDGKPEFKLKIDPEWLREAAEREDGGFVSVGGLIMRVEGQEGAMVSRDSGDAMSFDEYVRERLVDDHGLSDIHAELLMEKHDALIASEANEGRTPKGVADRIMAAEGRLEPDTGVAPE